ncbi:MAG: phytanoyl-CoA dioxygenase family protein [candidate division Zixibacteria bacterium]|nr:phytanoyl-CoA dioxygenase family protein [candidate division Zixibacteria bacterium]
MKLSDVGEHEVAFFQENGYLQLTEFYSKEEIEELGRALDQTVADKRARVLGGGHEGSEDYALVFNQMVNLWEDYGVVRKFSFDPRLAEIARRLSRCKHVVIYHDHALIKPGGEKSRATNWHQDAPYWPMEQIGALSAWIAVDDVSVENGCMQFIPGSHTFGKLEPVPLATEGASVLKNITATGVKVDVPPVVMDMKAGGVTFHHGCTFHYATSNMTDRPRRALAIIYIPEYVAYNGRWDAGGAKDMVAGHPFGGPKHPILAMG